MDLPPELPLFVAVARRGSFARVATERGLSRSAVSHAIRTLEERLGLRLFNRTTRSVTLTEAGAGLLAQLEPAMAAVEAALQSIDAYRDTPRGTLRLNLPRGAVPTLTPLIAPFLAAQPHVALEVRTNDAFVDIVREGFDAGVRFGESLAQDMITVPFGPPQRFAVVSAPSYLAHAPRPETPDDLVHHACIVRRFPSGAAHAWEFAKHERELSVAVSGRAAFDDGALIIAAARAGIGLAQVFADEARDDLAAGTLIRVLADWCPPFPGLYLYHPSRRQVPGPLRAFIAFAKAYRERAG